jgi:hypothetical protein
MSDASTAESDPRSKARVFISYSRKDLAFVDRLEAALTIRGFEPLIDRTEIYAFEEWWKRIEVLIAGADTFVFVLSPDSVGSGVAAKEIAFAASLNKRLAPIVYRPVHDEAVPEVLAKLHYVFFNDDTRFEESADRLAQALNIDIGWIRQHTAFGEQARRWVLANRPGGLLLRSPALEAAERWIAGRPRGAPAPTSETQTFVRVSRQAATRRRNILTASLAAGLVLALALAGLAYWQRGIAIVQEQLAEQNRNAAERRRIAMISQLATSERLLGNWDTAFRLAVHSARLSLQQRGPEIAGPDWALASIVWQSRLRLTIKNDKEVRNAVLSPDRRRIITTSTDNVAHVWDVENGTEIAALHGHERELNSVAFRAVPKSS